MQFEETSQKYVLLVEDDPNDELLTMRAIRKSHLTFPISVARDGLEALDFLFSEGAHVGRTPKGPPAVVLLDLNLPRLHGLEVLSRIRKDPRTALVPVVVLTSSKQEEDVVRSYRAGANGYIRKPVDFSEFVDVIKQIGVYWLYINELPEAAVGT